MWSVRVQAAWQQRVMRITWCEVRPRDLSRVWCCGEKERNLLRGHVKFVGVAVAEKFSGCHNSGVGAVAQIRRIKTWLA